MALPVGKDICARIGEALKESSVSRLSFTSCWGRKRIATGARAQYSYATRLDLWWRPTFRRPGRVWWSTTRHSRCDHPLW